MSQRFLTSWGGTCVCVCVHVWEQGAQSKQVLKCEVKSLQVACCSK